MSSNMRDELELSRMIELEEEYSKDVYEYDCHALLQLVKYCRANNIMSDKLTDDDYQQFINIIQTVLID